MSHSVFRSLARFTVSATAIVICPLAAGASPYTGFDFSNIDYWVGSGVNEAALVVDFRTPEGDSSYVWGYRWDGDATGEEMFRAIAGTTVLYGRDGGTLAETFNGSDPRLYLRSSAFGGDLGNSVFGIGYDTDGDGGSFISGFEGSETGHATDPDDDYREGWFNGYWSYWISDPVAPDWGYSGLGFSSRQLTDGSWDGWSFADFSIGDWGAEPSVPLPAQVPEPTTLGVILISSLGLLEHRRKQSDQ